jgi:hypothetical protein
MGQPRGGGAICRVPGPDPAKCCVFYGWVILAVRTRGRYKGAVVILHCFSLMHGNSLYKTREVRRYGSTALVTR